MTAEEMLAADAVPEGVSPALRAVWHGLRGEWEAAHALVQDEPGREAAWVHAWLHRIEGDLGNAGYWYRRAGRPVATGESRAEALTIARTISRASE